MVMSVKKWKSDTAAAGHFRSEALKAVDTTLADYHKAPSAQKVQALATAIEAWASEKSAEASGGYAKLLSGIRNRKSAVQVLVTEVRTLAAKPAWWPDKSQGSAYVADFSGSDRALLMVMRSRATETSIRMIAAMNVDWSALAWEQASSVASTAINVGYTSFGAGWEGDNGANNNRTNAGQMLFGTFEKLFGIVFEKAGGVLGDDPRVEHALKAANLSVSIVLGIVKFHIFKSGAMAKIVPLLGPIKEGVDAVAKGAVDLRLAHKSFIRVEAAQALVLPGSTAGDALDAFNTLLKIETAKSVVDVVYRLLKNTALVVTEVLTLGAMTVVQVVTALVELVVGFVYQLVYSLVFRKSVKKCREWVQAGALPQDLDFRGWIASCPLLGAYFMLGLSAGGGSVSALQMFGQSGVLNSTDFQAASVKMLRVRQAAAAMIQQTPVKVKWDGPDGEKFKWIDSLIASDALSASVGLNMTKMHHWSLSEDASRSTKAKHKFVENSNNAWSFGKRAWSVV